MGSAEVGGGGECRDCHDVLGFVWLYLDHEAPPTTCEELEAHLPEVSTASGRSASTGASRQLVRRCADGPEPVPTTVVESLRIRVERTILRGNISPS